MNGRLVSALARLLGRMMVGLGRLIATIRGLVDAAPGALGDLVRVLLFLGQLLLPSTADTSTGTLPPTPSIGREQPGVLPSPLEETDPFLMKPGRKEGEALISIRYERVR